MDIYLECPVSRQVGWCVAIILVVATACRVHGLAFGLPALYDPDEPLFVLNAVKLIRDQTLNPGWFGHPGTTTLYALAVVDIVVFAIGWLTGRYADAAAFGHAIYGDAALIWLPNRAFILVCGVICVYLTFRVAHRLFGPRVGLIAELLLAIDPLHIKYSQIIRTDIQATVFILLCVSASIDIARRGGRRSYIVAGIWLGLAIATKWPAGLIVVAMAGAALTRIGDHPQERRAQLINVAIGAATALVALVVASPYLVLDYPAVLRDLQAEGRPYHLGATGHGFWRNAAWYATTCLGPALGPVGAVVAVVGAGLAVRQNRVFGLAVAPFVVVFFVAISTQALIWDRWSVPLLPFVSIAAAVGSAAIWRWLQRSAGARMAPVAGIVLGLAVALPLLVSVGARAAERVNDSRRLSTVWIRDHVPPGSRVLSEYLALDLLNKGWRMLFPIGDGGCVDVDANVNAKISYTTINHWRGKRPIIDLGTMNPAMLPRCLADYAVLVDYDRYLAEEDRFRYPQEISNYERLIASGVIVATMRPVAGKIGGPIVRIVKLAGPPR